MIAETVSLGLFYFLIRLFSSPVSKPLVVPNFILPQAFYRVSTSIGFLVFLLILTQLFESLFKYFSYNLVGQLSSFSRVYTIQKIGSFVLGVPYNNYEQIKSGNVITAITQGSEAIRFQIEELFTMITLIFLLAAYLIVLVKLSAWMLVAATFFALTLAFLQRKLLPKVKSATVKSVEAFSRVNSILMENFNAYVYLNSVAEFNWPLKRLNSAAATMMNFSIDRYRLAAISQPLSKFLTVLFMGLLVVAGNFYWSSSDVKFAAIGTFFIALQRLAGKLVDLGQVFNSLANNFGPLSLLDNLLSSAHNVPTSFLADTSQNVPYDLGHLRLRSISYSYSNCVEKSLCDVSLDIAPYESIAIVGASGSGKSTLLKILTCLIEPHTGKFSVGEREMSYRNKIEYQHSLALVTHSPIIFSATICENITLVEPGNVNQSLLEQSVINAGLQPLIDSLDKGIFSMMGEDGRGFSSGQCQKIMIARALYRSPSYLFLDEATSNLDPRSEMDVSLALKRLKGRMSVVFVTHRLAGIKDFDQIYVMKHGRIVESGNYAELIMLGGCFHSMISTQDCN